MDKLEKILRKYLNNGSDRIDVTMVLALIQQCKKDTKEQLTLTDVMRSNLALLWWGWTTVWGVIGFIVGCIKLWNYYA
jgi:hypothetical protein